MNNTISMKEYKRLLATHSKMRKSKYGAVKTTVDGFVFDSKREAGHYCELKMEEADGKISSIEIHPSYNVEINGQHICRVVLDFRYWDKCNQRTRVVDTKGMDTPISKLKRKLVEAQHNIMVEVV